MKNCRCVGLDNGTSWLQGTSHCSGRSTNKISAFLTWPYYWITIQQDQCVVSAITWSDTTTRSVRLTVAADEMHDSRQQISCATGFAAFTASWAKMSSKRKSPPLKLAGEDFLFPTKRPNLSLNDDYQSLPRYSEDIKASHGIGGSSLEENMSPMKR